MLELCNNVFSSHEMVGMWLLICPFQGSCLFIKGTIDGVFVLHCGTIEGELSRQPKFELFEEDKREWLGKLSAPKL